MKRVLIISPHFPPVNAPDMQRVRMSLPYYKALGWEPVVLCVDEKFVSGYKDELLNETVPDDIEIHKIKAWPESFTRMFGVGNLSLRSYYNFKKAGTKLLLQRKFDLVFFSTALFHVCALGRYWQKKFSVPFIVDMHDPWRNDFFLDKPVHLRPPKFLMAHALDKKLESYTMPYASGIMSVSQAYIDNLKNRYPQLQNTPTLLLPFGVASSDFKLVLQKNIFPEVVRFNGKINVIYAGGINKFFLPLIKAFFLAFKKSVKNKEDYHFYFIGTSYARSVISKPVEKIAQGMDLLPLVTEVPQRLPYFSALSILMHADILFIPGSSDGDYNASKVYNNIYANKPIFSIFNEKSLVKEVINETQSGVVVGVLETDKEDALVQKIEEAMPAFAELHLQKKIFNQKALRKYLASAMTEKQVGFFNKVVLGQCFIPIVMALKNFVSESI